MKYGELVAFLMDMALTIMTRAAAIRDAATKNSEWTPEEEAAFQQKKRDAFASSRWQPTDTPPQPS